MRLALSLLAAIAAALAGCDDQIDTPDSLRGTYTLWGALDPTVKVQAVRVVPVTDTIGLGTAAPLPVTVVSVDLATGAETAWRDSVVTFSDGSIGHVYQAALQPGYGSRHRFVVRRDGGGEVSAIVAVPPSVEPVRQSVRLASGGIQYPVLWPGAPQLNRVLATFQVTDSLGAPREVTLALPGMEPRIVGASGPVEFGWQTVLDLRAASLAVRDELFGRATFQSVRLSGEVASDGWRPPGGVFDPDVLADPDAFGNVEGGFGFVGAAYRVELTITPTPCELTRTRFLNPPASPCP